MIQEKHSVLNSSTKKFKLIFRQERPIMSYMSKDLTHVLVTGRKVSQMSQ